MKTFKNMAAQGDLLLRRIEKLPDDAKSREAGGLILAHSETGHHHAIVAPPNVVQLFGSSDPLVGYLKVTKPVELKHFRDWDTHESLEIGEGIYEYRRQRERSPEGWRKVED